MKLKTKYPCEQCAEGTYMTVEGMWWCDKYLEYACGMERNHLCEKFERDDAVSRRAVLNTLDFTDKFLDETRTVESYKTLLEECYKNLPSVTPTRKKGKWIGHGEHCENLGVIPSGLGAYEWCSNCDCGIDVREWHRNHYNYCPNCGAEME